MKANVMASHTRLNDDNALWNWLAGRAGALNSGAGSCDVGESIRAIVSQGFLALGVPKSLGGADGTLQDAVEAIAAVSSRCMTSGFVFWCQRVFVEYLSATGNPWLQENVLPRILSGEWSGATGLSNAMKHLAGLERLRLEATCSPEQVSLTGTLPWVSNLRHDGFAVAVAAHVSADRSIVVAVPSDVPGVIRGEDFQLLGLQSSWTASVRLENVTLSRQWIISDDASAFLPRVRPAFILLQCGLALGIARRALTECDSALLHKMNILGPRATAAKARLAELEQTTAELVAAPRYESGRLREIFQLRIALTRLAVEAVQLEMEVRGGSGYFAASDTARRLREVNFLPILTPSLVQLETELQRSAPADALAAGASR